MVPEKVISSHKTKRGAARMIRDVDELRGKGDTKRVLTDPQLDVLLWAGSGPCFIRRRRVFRSGLRFIGRRRVLRYEVVLQRAGFDGPSPNAGTLVNIMEWDWPRTPQ